MKKLITLLFGLLIAFNINAIDCTGITSWSSGGQPAGGTLREYNGKVYSNCACNGWDGAGDNPEVNAHWTYVDDCGTEPTVTTQPAGAITTTTMTLNGTVVSGTGFAILDRGFIYGTSSADVTNSEIGALVGSSIAVSEGGTTVTAYSQGITALCPGIRYYFKAYATNSTGTGYGTVDDEITTSPGTYTSTQDGPFTSAATWGGCGPPDLTIGNTINIGHNVTSSGLTITEGTDVIVTSGGVLNNTGTITLGGTSNPTFTVNVGGTATTTDVTYTSVGTLTSNGTFTITNDLNISNGGIALLGGTTIINGNASNNGPGNFEVTGGTLQVDGNVSTFNDGRFNASGTVTIGGNWSVGGSGGSVVDGTVTAAGQLSVTSNGYIIGTGVISYGTKDINPSNSGAYVGCIDGTKWDDNVGTPTWDEIDNPWDLTTCAKSLPVELIEFYLINNGDIITLYWTTGSEINNDYFEVQTSIDGINWVSEGRVIGMGNSIMINHYDYHIKSSSKYFKLKQVDFDGTYAYSKIVVSNSSISENIITSSRYFIMVRNEERYIVSIYQIDGALVYEEEHEGRVFISKSGFSPGIYVVRVNNQNIKIYVHGD